MEEHHGDDIFQGFDKVVERGKKTCILEETKKRKRKTNNVIEIGESREKEKEKTSKTKWKYLKVHNLIIVQGKMDKAFAQNKQGDFFDIWELYKILIIFFKILYFFILQKVRLNTDVWGDMNHMAGPQGPIGPWFSHKLCSTVNITPILFAKAAVHYSHHELQRTFRLIFLMLTQIIILRGIVLIF